MTLAPAAPAGRWWSPGRRFTAAALIVVIVAVARAAAGGEIVNGNGWPSFARFWTAVVRPEVGAEFVRLTIDAAVVTLSYAVLGTALSLVLGAVAALALSELLWARSAMRTVARLVLVVPRAVHEILWALLLIQIFGFDPLVPILAIAIPFGAVTAKVFAETIDEADPGPYRQLRASGAGRLGALAYGVLPVTRGELVSYAFYRFECSVRSAAVLGVVGAGGLGFQLDLSFETLRYREIWTLIIALMVLSGAIEAWSSLVRRSLRTGDNGSNGDRSAVTVGRVSFGAVLVLIPLAWRWVDLDLSTLWSSRSRDLAADLARDLVPPRLGLGGWRELIEASLDTVAMSILALVVAVLFGLVFGAVAASPVGPTAGNGRFRRIAAPTARLVLLLFRAVPAPIWAFLMVLVLFPGLWPGAVALGIYTLGVLGRLFAEAFEDRDINPSVATDLVGATAVQTFFYGTLPTTSNRLIALASYRWEVISRETVVVGVVGAGGLGQLMNEHLAARDFAAITGAIAALVVITVIIDSAGGRIRRTLRGPTGRDQP